MLLVLDMGDFSESTVETVLSGKKKKKKISNCSVIEGEKERRREEGGELYLRVVVFIHKSFKFKLESFESVP